MLCHVRAVSNEDALPDSLAVRFQSLFFRDVAQGQASKYTNVLKVLSLVCPSFFRDYLAMALSCGWESDSKVMSCLDCFCSKLVGQTTINQYQVFRCDNSALSSLSQPILLVYIWSGVSYGNALFLTKKSELDRYKLSITVCLKYLHVKYRFGLYSRKLGLEDINKVVFSL